MRVYLDTNIIMEYFGHRNLFDPVCAVLKASEQDAVQACISTNSLDTIIYLLGLQLKDHGLHEPAKRQQICNILKSVLSFLDVVSIDKEGLISALDDHHFKDIEDSIQFHCAEENHADFLLTINTRHFKNAKGNVRILSPTEFVSQHLNAIQ